MRIHLRARSISKSSGRREVTLKRLESKEKASGRAFNIANKKVATFLLDKSRIIVPIDEKDLYNSSRVIGVGRGFANEQFVEYRMPYALMQHENLEYKHEPGKSAKYLTKPAAQFRSEMRRIMRDEIAARARRFR